MVTVPRGIAYNLLREAAGLAGRADQYIAFVGIDDFGEVSAVFPLEPDLVQPGCTPGEIPLVLVEILSVITDDAAAVQGDDSALEGLAFDPFLLQLPANLPRDANASRTGTINNRTAFGERRAADAGSSVHGGRRNRSGTLDVVVE